MSPLRSTVYGLACADCLSLMFRYLVVEEGSRDFKEGRSEGSGLAMSF